MTWNGWGENIVTDWSQAPWTSGIMTLSHDEVMHVWLECDAIIENYKLANKGLEPDSNLFVVPRYNELDWVKCVNGDTYTAIKSYNPEVNLLGINAAGIIQPEPVEELPEEPPVEEVPEEQPVEEPEAPVEEPVTEEEPVVE